jgi:hypothetical protein
MSLICFSMANGLGSDANKVGDADEFNNCIALN